MQCNWRDPSRVQDGGSQRSNSFLRAYAPPRSACEKLGLLCCSEVGCEHANRQAATSGGNCLSRSAREKQTEDHRLQKFLLVDNRQALKVGEARSFQWVQKKKIKPEVDMFLGCETGF